MHNGGPDAASPSAAKPLLRFRLSVMMFLEFFIWGAWLPLLGSYLEAMKFGPGETAWIFNAFALASFTAMFFSTQFADRNFAAEKFLAFSQLIGGIAILLIFYVPAGWTTEIGGFSVNLSFWAFFGLMLVHSLFYVPTISITNAIAFANLKDAQRDFGIVRLWGTIGWIAVSVPMVFILVDWARVPAIGSTIETTVNEEVVRHQVTAIDWLGKAMGTPLVGEAGREGTRYIFLVSGIASLVLAGFSLALPHTPPRPPQPGGERFAWLEAMKLLAKPFVLVLFLVTFVDALVHAGYFFYTGAYLTQIGIPQNWIMPAMSIGQIAEIATMAILGLVLKNLGWKWTMVIGILGHAARFGIFALVPEPYVALAANLLHGICYAFFFATVYIFVDAYFPKDARSSAQGLFNFLILGAGPFAGNFLWAFWKRYNSVTETLPTGEEKVISVDYHNIFLLPSAVALVGALLLLLFFWPPKQKVE
jgi:MFS family permease